MKDTILAWKFHLANKRRIVCRTGDLCYVDTKRGRVIHIIIKPRGKFATRTLCGIRIAHEEYDVLAYKGRRLPCARCAVSWNVNAPKKKQYRAVRLVSAKSTRRGIHHHWIGGMRTLCGIEIKNETWDTGRLRPVFVEGKLCLKCQKSRK